MNRGNALIADIIVVGGALGAAAASATVITFSGLTGANGTPVATYTEGGFIVTTVATALTIMLSASDP
jgi:hypothetical protein